MMKQTSSQVLIHRAVIQRAVSRLANSINEDYEGKDPVLICVMTGAFVFFSDLIRQLTIPHQIDFIKIGTYGNERNPRVPKSYLYPSLNIFCRHIIVVDDILDTGRTGKFVTEIMDNYHPLSLTFCFLLSKKAHREHNILTPYIGIEIADHFVYGYGLDLQERQRHLLDIYEDTTDAEG